MVTVTKVGCVWREESGAGNSLPWILFSLADMKDRGGVSFIRPEPVCLVL